MSSFFGDFYNVLQVIAYVDTKTIKENKRNKPKDEQKKKDRESQPYREAYTSSFS